MSFIGDMLGTNNGYEAQGADSRQQSASWFRTENALDRQSDFLNALGAQNGLGNQRDVFGQQQGFANQLQGMVNGTGPNPALAQLNQSTGQNVANQSALMAGQRGAGANTGLMARLAAQQGAGIQQNAVGQAATMQAQQQMAAVQALQQQQAQMAGTANQQIAQQQTGLSAFNDAALRQHGNLLGIQASANNANAQTAAGNQQMNGQIAGGLLGGAGTAGMAIMGGGGGGMGNGTGAKPVTTSAGTWRGADGGAAGGTSMLGGGQVPGKPEVGHNSYKNDTVPAMLSPGEQVIDLNTLHDSGPVGEAARFVANHINKRNQAMSRGGQVHGYKDGGGAGESEDKKEIPVAMPDPKKARDAYKGLDEGQTFAKGFENAKKFFSNPMENFSKADGGEIKSWDGSALVPDYLNTPTDKLAFPKMPTPEEERAHESTQALEGLKEFGSSAKEFMFGDPVKAMTVNQSEGKIYNPSMSNQVATAKETAAPKVTDQYNLGAEQPADIATMPTGQVPSSSGSGVSGMIQASDDDQASVDLEHMMDMNSVLDRMKDVEPGRYLTNMGPGQKVSTAIGLILGGIGGGLTHQENPALKFLTNAIDKDVEAQKANIGKENDILKAYEAKYKDRSTAISMYKATNLANIAQILKQKAALQGSAMVQQRADAAINRLNGLAAQNLTEAGSHRMKAKAMPQAGDIGAIIATMPKELHKQAYEELGNYRGVQSSIAQVAPILDKLYKDSRASNQLSSPLQSALLMKQARAKLFPVVKRIIGEKMSDKDADAMLNPFLTGMSGNENTKNAAIQGLEDSLWSKVPELTPILSEQLGQYGISLGSQRPRANSTSFKNSKK